MRSPTAESDQTIQAWLGATLALDLGTTPEDVAAHLRRDLTLHQESFGGSQSDQVPYWMVHDGWLHIPRAYTLSPRGRWLLGRTSISDGRSEGHPLPSGTSVTVELGIPPYPEGQPKFVADAVPVDLPGYRDDTGMTPRRRLNLKTEKAFRVAAPSR